MKITILILIVLLTLTTCASALPVFTGSLSTPSGVVASPGWNSASGGFKIAWTISEVSANNWYYQYTLSNASDGELPKAPSHLIVEISTNATCDDFWGFNGDEEINTYSSADSSNPNMPGPMYGVKMEGAKNGTSNLYEYFFHSKKAPTWGDFYSKDGKYGSNHTDVTAWNTDYLQTDPTAAAQNGLLQNADGSYIYKILRPDTQSTVVPEPGTLMLLGLGMSLLFLGLRAKS